MSLITISNPGFPLSGRFNDDQLIKFILERNLPVQTLDNRPYVGFDVAGKVVYLDYERADVKAVIGNLTNTLFEESQLTTEKFGVNLMRNEISRQMCTI